MSYYSKLVPSKKIIDASYIRGMSTNMFGFNSCNISEGVTKIREDIQSLFAINKRECFFSPNIGSNLSNLVFETNDFLLADLIRKTVTTDIENHLDNVRVSDVQISQDYDAGYIKVYVKYDIISLATSDEITLYESVREKIKF